jgi:glycosyltransferase involved in cell wall biosynthesis
MFLYRFCNLIASKNSFDLEAVFTSYCNSVLKLWFEIFPDIQLPFLLNYAILLSGAGFTENKYLQGRKQMLREFAISVFNRIFNYLPCYIINHEPLIIISYWRDFDITRNDFIKALQNRKDVYILIQIGWQRETPERAREIVNTIAKVHSQHQGMHFTFLCNSPAEQENLANHGLDAVFCHQNAFIDENLYPVIPNAEKLYDAIYIARVTPFKRQELARNIKTLRLIGWTSPQEKEYFDSVMASMPQAEWSINVASSKIYNEINAARAGLCLSEEEGAMFVSTEYMLCGIPAVTTRNRGGREHLFPENAFCYVEDSPEAVAEGIYKMIKDSPPPQEIRRACIEKMHEHRRIFIELVQKIIDSTGTNLEFKQNWNKVFIHKFGLRRRISIWKKIKNGIKRK